MSDDTTDPRVEVRVGDRLVGPAHPPYLVAEVSANHGGSLERAEEIVRRAAESGAHAVKLQTYTPEAMTLDLPAPPFLIAEGTLWSGRTLYELYEEGQTPWEWHEPLFALAQQLGLDCFSTPFDRAAVDFLERFDPPAHKIASFELLDLELIAHAASTGRPLIISTGMATHPEIDEAVETARSSGAGGIILLRCNSAYPANPEEMDLATIPEMERTWDVPIGLSDHTHGSLAGTVAAALGASLFEKHVTLSRRDGGPDAAFSTEPAEFAQYCSDVRMAARVVGQVRFGPSIAERPSLAFRRSLYVVEEIPAGASITRANVRAIRPSGGLPPGCLPDVLGRSARCDLHRGTPLTEDVLN